MSPSQRPLSLVRALSGSVSLRTRGKGTAYFERNAVISLETDETSVRALVQGTRRYSVQIRRIRGGYGASCDCPFFLDRTEICKHIWAVVLATDREGLLSPDADHTWMSGEVLAGLQAPPPPERWEQFLNGLARQLDAPVPVPPVSRYRDAQLLYAIELGAAVASKGVPILVLARHRKKNGEWRQPEVAPVGPADIASLQDPEDREILPVLLGSGESYELASGYAGGRAAFVLVPPLLDRLLPRLAQTGRLHLREHAGNRMEVRPLAWDDGPPWTFEPRVHQEADDTFVVHGAIVRGDEVRPLEEPRLLLRAGYLVSAGRLARFDAGGKFPLLTELRRVGAMRIPDAAAPRLVETLARFGVDPDTLPEGLRYEVVTGSPRPRASITRGGAYAAYGNLQVAVAFDYDGLVVPPDLRKTSYDAERRRLVRRDEAAEAAAVERLEELGVRRTWPDAGAQFTVTLNAFPTVVKTLAREGWRVEADGRVFRPPQSLDVHVKSGVDWFELHGRVDFGDGASASMPELLASLRKGDASVLLDDGSLGMVPEDWLRKYLRVASFGEAAEDHIRYRPSQAALLDALLEAQPAIAVDETFARARVELKRFAGVSPIDPPRTFKGTLREYQREALGWFEFLRRFGLGGCLADDMGLGKTVMVLALLESRRVEPGDGERLPSLAVVPRSLVFNWKDEAARFSSKLRVLDYTGASRDPAAIADYDLVLTTYGTLRQDAAALTTLSFDYVILDEAQAIKNPSTASAKAARLLRARHRLALSGTPIENHVGELWSIFEFLNPGLLGTANAFRTVSSVTRGDAEDLAMVTRAVKPMILRRTKAQVEPQLPPRTEQTIVCELEGRQRKFYDKLRDNYRATLLARVARGGMARAKLQVLEALLRLRQAACHPALVDPMRLPESSAKLDALLPQLLEVTGEGHKALVFSQFTSFLAILRERLEDDGIVHEYLDGKTTNRAERVRRFNEDPDCRVFLISLKAGGVGLNLTAAEYVFLLDPWWNPAVEAQAIDRAHRIGQERHVFAYRLIARDTVEEKVAELQDRKREVADAILNADPALIRNLTVEDLRWLLE